MTRENVPGRANVEDTPELQAYYRDLEARALGALWTVANDIEPWYPRPDSVPMLWKWREIEPYVRRAPSLVSADRAGRRVVMLVNPGRKAWSAAVGLLYTGVQIMNPGEYTTAHRHQ
ncbi:MAG: NADPH dehydrogenase, partial [Burkholderiales bacterium]|nr:NADPH dehydrogenase [Burkholderiales bacterium]